MIYLIHFDERINPDHPTQHYVGFCEMTPANRLRTHKAGRGARLTQVANERDIDYDIVRAWHGERADERRMKNRKEAPRFCPICQAQPKQFDTKEIELC